MWFTTYFGNEIERAAVTGAGTSFANALRIAQIVDGASWKTSFQVLNLDQSPVTYSFQCWDDNGNPLPLPIVNGSPEAFSGTLAVGGTAFAETPGTSVSLAQGGAEVASSGNIGVLAIFRQSVSGSPDSEGSVTGMQSGSRVFLPFDNLRQYWRLCHWRSGRQYESDAVTLNFFDVSHAEWHPSGGVVVAGSAWAHGVCGAIDVPFAGGCTRIDSVHSFDP